MSTVFDTAKYILEQKGEMTAIKLQKLVYYAQAWALVWDEEPLFDASIEAWLNGPVVPILYEHHRGKYKISVQDMSEGNSAHLTDNQKDTIDSVLNYYGDKSAKWLSDLSHLEDPWKNARRGLAPDERGKAEITQASMAEYYSSILVDTDKNG